MSDFKGGLWFVDTWSLEFLRRHVLAASEAAFTRPRWHAGAYNSSLRFSFFLRLKLSQTVSVSKYS